MDEIIAKDLSKDFVSRLVRITNSDRLVWENHKWEGRDFDIAYCSPWILCLSSNQRPHPLLQIARSYHRFAELEGIDYCLGSLLLVIASQNCRVRSDPDNPLFKKIDEGKIKKFLRDKLLRDKREKLFRETIFSSCQQSLNALTEDFVNGT